MAEQNLLWNEDLGFDLYGNRYAYLADITPDRPLDWAESVRKKGLMLPRASDTASIVDFAIRNTNWAYSKDIVDLLHGEFLLYFTGRSFCKEGIYVKELLDKIETDELKMPADVHLRFSKKDDKPVPYSLNGKVDSGSLQTNFAVNAIFGEVGARRLSSAAQALGNECYLDVINPDCFNKTWERFENRSVGALTIVPDGRLKVFIGDYLGGGKDYAFALKSRTA